MAAPTKEELRRQQEAVELAREELELLKAKKAAGDDVERQLRDAQGVLTQNLDKVRATQEARRKESTAIEEQIDLLKQQEDQIRTLGRSLENNQMLHENQIEQQQKIIEKAREQISLQDKNTEAGKKAIRVQESAIKNAQERLELAQEQNAAAGRANDLIKSQLGGTTQLTNAMEEYAEASKAGQGSMYLLAKATEKSAGAFNFMLSSIKSMVMGAHIAEKQFEKTFQLPAEYTTRLHENYKALNEYGVSAEEAATATGDLVTNVTEFTMASGTQQDSLVKTTALLAETGIASADVAKGVQTSMKMFGQSIKGAETTALELAAVARELQVVPGEMAAQYAAMGPQLAKFGQEGISTFKELSRIQKLTGMEMGKVLQIANKFDTFEDAATATGKLNAALGGNFVNAMDMMMDTDPASRFETIRGAIEQAGLSFDTMSYYQKQFYTDALGLSDVGDLALMLSGRTDLMTDATNASAESYEQQAERAKSVQNIQEQLQNILADNADEFLKLATMAAKFLHFLSDNMWIVKTFTAVLGALKVMQVASAITTGALSVANFLMKESMSKSKKEAIQSGVALGVFALALGLIAAAMFMKSPSLLVIELVALAGALWLTSKILSKATPAMTAAGAGMAAFGVGLWAVIPPIAILIVSVAILAAGIGYMASSFGEMFNALSPEKMALVTTFLLSFGLGAIGMVAAGVGLIAFAIGMGALAFALKFIATDDLTAIATIMESIGEIPTGGMGDSASGIRGIATAIDEISIDSLSALEKTAAAFSSLGSAVRGALVPLQSLMTSMSALQTDNIAGLSTALQGTADAISDIPVMKTMVLTLGFGAMALAATSLKPIALAFAAGGGGAAAGRASTAAARPATGAPGAGGGTSAQNITVRLELDGKLLEEKVVKIMGDQYKPIFAGQG